MWQRFLLLFISLHVIYLSIADPNTTGLIPNEDHSGHDHHHDNHHGHNHHHGSNDRHDEDHSHNGTSDHVHHGEKEAQETVTPFQLWLYGTGAVIFISVLGLMAIMTIPKIQAHHHGDVLQLLVGLAIGTLTSDALLHLLPHAFSGETHNHKQSESTNHKHHEDDEDRHTQTVYYGLMALMGIIGFLAIERILTIVSDLCSKSNRKTTKVGNCNNRSDPKDERDLVHNHKEHSHKESLLASSELEKLAERGCEQDQLKDSSAVDAVTCMSAVGDKHAQLTTEQCHRETMVYQHPDPDRGYVVQLLDHHHHHQHQSGHQGAKSVIYMIVTGDGLHNFFDGLAIGIAFAGGGIGGGLSTSVAVLCHELPHEVGDFAVLLKAGLAVKKAVLYNTLSAFLCFIGMTVGIFVAKMDTAMLSSLIAGMFLYIALVDMIPQLDCCPTAAGGTRALKLSIQLLGMAIGVSIMSVISIYEPTLQNFLAT